MTAVVAGSLSWKGDRCPALADGAALALTAAAATAITVLSTAAAIVGRGLHSSAFQLNLKRF